MSSPTEPTENVTATQSITDNTTHNLSEKSTPVVTEENASVDGEPTEQHAENEDAEPLKDNAGESNENADMDGDDEVNDSENAEENEGVENEDDEDGVEEEEEAAQKPAQKKKKPVQQQKKKATAQKNKTAQKRKPAQKKSAALVAPEPKITSFKELVEYALCALKDRNGSSAQAIVKYAKANLHMVHKIQIDPEPKDTKCLKQVNKTLSLMCDEESVERTSEKKFKLSDDKKQSVAQKKKDQMKKFKAATKTSPVKKVKKSPTKKSPTKKSPTKKSPTKKKATKSKSATKLKKAINKTPPKNKRKAPAAGTKRQRKTPAVTTNTPTANMV